jgi:hypothetical protein
MSRAIGITFLLGLLAVSAVGSSAAGSGRLTRCVASTFTQSGSGTALFVGTCNGSATSLKASPGSVVGRVGGLNASLKGSGLDYAGRIGGLKTSFSAVGGTLTGRYGTSALRFELLGNAVIGRVGSRRVSCSITTLAPFGERVACRGAGGGAETLLPLLAVFYAAP